MMRQGAAVLGTARGHEGSFRGRAAELRTWLDQGGGGRPDYYHPVRVCGLFGALRVLSMIKGAIPLVHGTMNCTYFQKFQITVSFDHPVVAPTTDLAEADVIHGGEDRLRESILDVDRRYRPELLVVLNTCTPAIIGDDVTGVISSVRSEVNARYLFGLDADGLQFYHQGYGYNNALRGLVDNVMSGDGVKIPASVNLFGEVIGGDSALAREKGLLARLLARTGILVNAVLPADATVAEIERAPRAMANVTRCAVMADTATDLMQERFGTKTVSVPMPYGLHNTDRWLDTIAALFGRERAARRVKNEEHARLAPLMDRARRRLEGKVAAIHGGPGRVIGNIMVAHELGMKIGMVSLFFATRRTLDQLLAEIEATGDDPVIFLDCSLEQVRTAADELGIEVWFGNSLDFPETYERRGITAFETLIYQEPYEGYEGYGNALEHFLQRDILSANFGCRRRPSGRCQGRR